MASRVVDYSITTTIFITNNRIYDWNYYLNFTDKGANSEQKVHCENSLGKLTNYDVGCI